MEYTGKKGILEKVKANKLRVGALLLAGALILPAPARLVGSKVNNFIASLQVQKTEQNVNNNTEGFIDVYGVNLQDRDSDEVLTLEDEGWIGEALKREIREKEKRDAYIKKMVEEREAREAKKAKEEAKKRKLTKDEGRDF